MNRIVLRILVVLEILLCFNIDFAAVFLGLVMLPEFLVPDPAPMSILAVIGLASVVASKMSYFHPAIRTDPQHWVSPLPEIACTVHLATWAYRKARRLAPRALAA